MHNYDCRHLYNVIKNPRDFSHYTCNSQPVFVNVYSQTQSITMSGLWTRYNKLLEAQPLLTKAFTSLIGFTAGDVLAQNFINEDGQSYDPMRTLRLGSFGFLLHGTTGHYFYGFLDGKMPGTKPITVASKVAIDQFFWNPIFGCMFFGYLNFSEGRSVMSALFTCFFFYLFVFVGNVSLT